MSETRIAIDLNLRVRGSQTYAGFEDVEGELPQVGEYVAVYERESGIAGKGEVTEVDVDRQLIYLHVNWSDLAVPFATGLGAFVTTNTYTAVKVVNIPVAEPVPTRTAATVAL